RCRRRPRGSTRVCGRKSAPPACSPRRRVSSLTNDAALRRDARPHPEERAWAGARAGAEAVKWDRSRCDAPQHEGAHKAGASKRSPAISAGLHLTLDTSAFDALPFDLDVGAWTRPSDLDARLAHASALLDDHVAITRASADRDVAVAVHAVLVAQRSDTVFPADSIGARRQRKRGRRRHRERDGKNMNWSHPRASICSPRLK